MGGADIIDVKNPKEGSLGASFPWIIKRIKEIAPTGIEVSCTLGDLPNLPGTASLAALGAASLGVNYIKTSLYGLQTKDEAVFMMQNVVRSVSQCNSTIKIAAAGFADAHRINSIDPMLIPEIALESKCDLAMLDTAIKDGKNLLDFLNSAKLKEFVSKTHSFGLTAALAGSLRKEDLPTISALNVDIIGLRGAACTSGDRVKGQITREKVRELANVIKKSKKIN
jgi:(5-formylfuran-3-yl)methyl phosphate synthase